MFKNAAFQGAGVKSIAYIGTLKKFEHRAIKEGNTFRFPQSIDLGNGDIIELKEDRSRWKVISLENYKVGNIPISFNVKTNPILKSPKQITIV